MSKEPKAEPKVEAKTNRKNRAKPNWDDAQDQEVGVDRLKLPSEFLEKYKEYSFTWIMDSALGQQDPQWRGRREATGWTPVHNDDFEGDIDGLFMKRGDTKEVNVGGLVLAYRPAEITERARKRDRAAALEQVQIKEQALRGGDIPVSAAFETQSGPTATVRNVVNRTVERIAVPESRSLKE